MEKLIKVSKSSIFFFLLISCMSTTKISTNSYLFVSSVLDKDICNLSINGEEYLKEKEIITERSLGIDLKNQIVFKLDKKDVHLSVNFKGKIVPDLDLDNNYREISLDTVLDVSKGRYFMINAKIKTIEVIQSKKEFVLD